MSIADAPIIIPTHEDLAVGPVKFLQSLHKQYGCNHGIVKILLPVDCRPDYNVWKGSGAKFTPKLQSLQMLNGITRQERLFELQLRLKRFKS